MPIMFHQYLNPSKTQPDDQLQDVPTYYGHLRQQATICGHTIHPSASQHMPLCPSCTNHRAKCRMDAALKALIAEGGLVPAEYQRDRRWQRAKLQYEIAKQRQAKVRSRDQLREEREQAWEEAHMRSNSQPLQAPAAFRTPDKCPTCAVMSACYSTSLPETQAVKNVTWWEQPGGLVADHILVPRSPEPRAKPAKPDMPNTKPPSILRTVISNIRKGMNESKTQVETWERRYRTESAVRRKHSLGEDHHFEPEFWDIPVSAFYSRQHYLSEKDEQRMAERRARGNMSRPKPPRSSLSYVQSPDEAEFDHTVLEQLWKMEEMQVMERESRKAGEEVSYLYFVGPNNGLWEWRADFLRSNRQLVYRKTVVVPESETFSSESTEVGEDEADEDSDEDMW